jgi:hypothetical protein
MIRELPSLLAGTGALMLFGLILTGARSPEEADTLLPSASSASAVHVKPQASSLAAKQQDTLAFNH